MSVKWLVKCAAIDSIIYYIWGTQVYRQLGPTTYSPDPSSAFISPNHAPGEQHSTNWVDSPALQLFLFNARSMVNKLNQVQSFIYSSQKPDLITDKEILQAGFTIFIKDQDSWGSGVYSCRGITLTTATRFNHCKIVYPSTSGDSLYIFPQTQVVPNASICVTTWTVFLLVTEWLYWETLTFISIGMLH